MMNILSVQGTYLPALKAFCTFQVTFTLLHMLSCSSDVTERNDSNRLSIVSNPEGALRNGSLEDHVPLSEGGADARKRKGVFGFLISTLVLPTYFLTYYINISLANIQTKHTQIMTFVFNKFDSKWGGRYNNINV